MFYAYLENPYLRGTTIPLDSELHPLVIGYLLSKRLLAYHLRMVDCGLQEDLLGFNLF